MKTNKKRFLNRVMAITMVMCFGFFTFRLDVMANSTTSVNMADFNHTNVNENISTSDGSFAGEEKPFMALTMDEWAARQNRALAYGGIKSLFIDAPNSLAQGIAMMAVTGADGTTVATFVLDLVSQVTSGLGEALAQGKSPQMMAAGIVLGAIGGVLDLVSNMLKIFTYQPQPMSDVQKFRKDFKQAIALNTLERLEKDQQQYLDVIGKLAKEYDSMKEKVKEKTTTIKNIITSQTTDSKWQDKLTKETTGNNGLKALVNDFARKVKYGPDGDKKESDEGDGNSSVAWTQIVNLSQKMTGNGNPGQSTLQAYAKVLVEHLTPRDESRSLEQSYNNLQDYFSSLSGSQLQALNFHAEYLNSDQYRPHGNTPTQKQRKEALDDKFKQFQILLKDQAHAFQAATKYLGEEATHQKNIHDNQLMMYYQQDTNNVKSLAVAFLASLFAPMGNDSPYPAKVVFVSPEGGSKGKDGKSWETARAGLQVALGDVEDGQYTELWLKAGTYYATTANENPYSSGETGDTLRSFQMKNGCAIFGGFAGYEVSCEQRDVVNNKTILDGQSKVYHVIMNHNPTSNGGNDNNSLKLGSSAMLDGVIVKNGGFGRTGFPNPHEHGGGMFNGFGAAPYIANCVFESNYARDCGGAVVNLNASPYFTNCVFSGNESGGNSTRWAAGGAVAQLKLNDTPKGTAVFEKCLFQNNHSLHSGGAVILADKMNSIFNDCGFIGNYAGGYGGAVYTQAWSCYLEINNSYFQSNYTTGNNGGAINVTNGAIANIANCTFYDNHAERDGGAISIDCDKTESPCVVANCTFFKNYTRWANWGSSVRLWGNRNLQFKNNIVKGPDSLRGGEIPLWLSASSIDARRNIYDTGYNIPNSNKQNNDPQIHDPVYNGGWWPTCAINAGSPAQNYAIVSVDSGVNTTIEYDARGRKRETPDCGAFEYTTKTTFYVVPPPKNNDLAASKANISQKQDGSSWSKACSLEQALLLAMPGDEIWAKQGRYYPQFSCGYQNSAVQPSLVSSSGARSFVLRNNVSLYGGFIGEESDKENRVKDASLTILDGNIDLTRYDTDKPLKDTGKFKLPDGTEIEIHANAGHVVAANYNSIIDGFSIVNGEAARANFSSGLGGGVLMVGYGNVVQNCQVNYNTGSASAAACSDHGFSNTISRCLITGNSSDGDSEIVGVNKIDNSTICDNQGSAINTGNGGTVEYCTIAGNTKYGFYNSTATCSYSIFKNAQSASNNGSVTFTECYGNTAGQDDPKLGDLAQNGGWTATKALLPDSPCLNQGPDSPRSLDQRGVARAYGKADLGAFESRGELFIVVETSDPALGFVKENGGAPAPSFIKAVTDGQFLASDLNYGADPKDGRELVSWRYLDKVPDPKDPNKKITQLGDIYSTGQTLKFSKPLIFGGHTEKTAVIQATFSVPHYQVSCEVVVFGKEAANGVIFGDQPPTWRDINAQNPDERVTGPIPKSTEDSADHKTAVFSIYNQTDLTLNFKGLGDNEVRYVSINDVFKDVNGGKAASITINKVEKNYEVKAWFSEGQGEILSVTTQANPNDGGTITQTYNGKTSQAGTQIVPKGKSIEVEAKPASGYQFTQWTTTGDAVISKTQKTCPKATVHIVSTNTTITAIFDKASTAQKSLTVLNGTGSGRYTPGQLVRIQAYNCQGNQRFTKWTATNEGRDDINLNWDEDSLVTTFIMPDQDLTIESVWEDLPPGQVTLNVLDGSGSANYNSGESVTIEAYDKGKYLTFREWTLYDPFNELDFTIDDLTDTPISAVASVTVPDASVTIEAIYDITSDLQVERLRITTNESKDEKDSVKIMNAELPDDFELSDDIMENLTIQVDDYEFPIGQLVGEWKTKNNGYVVFQSDKQESPTVKLTFDMAKNLWSFDAKKFDSYGEIGNGDGAVKLVASVDDAILFASNVTDVEETCSWSYCLKNIDNALVATEYDGEFGFVGEQAKIVGCFKGVGGVGETKIKIDNFSMGLPTGTDLLQTMEFSLNDFELSLNLLPMGKDKYQENFVGNPKGWVKVDAPKDLFSCNLDLIKEASINVNSGLTIILSTGEEANQCEITPKIKRILKK